MDDDYMFSSTPVIPTTVTIEYGQDEDVLNSITITSTDNSFIKELLTDIMENRKTSIKEGWFIKE